MEKIEIYYFLDGDGTILPYSLCLKVIVPKQCFKKATSKLNTSAQSILHKSKDFFSPHVKVSDFPVLAMYLEVDLAS